MEIAIEIIGILGIIASIVSFQCKEHKNILIMRTANEMLFALQYLLLGAYTGMAMNLVGSTRNMIFTKTVKENKGTRICVILFSILFTAFGLLTWQGPKSILIIIAKVLSTLAYSSKNTTLVRGLVFVTSTAWLIYNACVGSTAGVINEGFAIISIIVGTLRYDVIPRLKRA